jgi:hypothetical protein
MTNQRTNNYYELQLSAILVALLLNLLLIIFIFCLYQQDRSTAPLITQNFDHEDIMITIQPDIPVPPEPDHSLSPITTQQEEEVWVQTMARQSNFSAQGPQDFIEPEDVTTDNDQKEEDHHNLENALSESGSVSPAILVDEAIGEPNVDQMASIAVIEVATVLIPKVEEKITPAKLKKSVSRKITKKKTLPSVATMAQGFLDQIKENGTSAVTMLSKHHGIPSQMQLQHERYLEKLFWLLQKTFRNNEDKIPPANKNRTMDIYFELYKSGMLKKIDIRGTSDKNTQFDTAVLLLFKETSLGFPPVPRALTRDPYEMTVRIEFSPFAQMR